MQHKIRFIKQYMGAADCCIRDAKDFVEAIERDVLNDVPFCTSDELNKSHATIRELKLENARLTGLLEVIASATDQL